MLGRTARKMQHPTVRLWPDGDQGKLCGRILVGFTHATSFRARGYSTARVQKHVAQHGSSQPRDKVLRRLASVGKSNGVASRYAWCI